MAVESHHSNIGYSKVRVAFDGDQKQSAVKSTTLLSNNLSSSSHTMASTFGPPSSTLRQPDSYQHNFYSRFTALEHDPPLPSHSRFAASMQPQPTQGTTHSTMGSPAGSVNNDHSNVIQMNNAIIGDVCEPFWIQSTKEGSMWAEPDEMFLSESKRFFTVTDKRVFWEMAKALIELPEISNACKGVVSNASDLVNMLKKPEWKVVWTNEASDILPRDMAAELVKAAYVYQGAGPERV